MLLLVLVLSALTQALDPTQANTSALARKTNGADLCAVYGLRRGGNRPLNLGCGLDALRLVPRF